MVDFKQIVENNKELIIKKTRELIQIPSVLDESTASESAPFGLKIQEALDYMMNLAKEDGFETALDGGYGPLPIIQIFAMAICRDSIRNSCISCVRKGYWM